MNMKPLNDRILVKRIEAEEKTKSGIIIPDASKERPHQGVVLAVGPGRLLESGERAPMTVSVGDKVIFGKWSSNDLRVDGVDVSMLQESDVFAIIE